MSSADRELTTYTGEPVELYEFIRGGTSYRFTSADFDVPAPSGIGGADFLSNASISRSEPEQSKEVQQTKLTVFVERDNSVATLFKFFVPFVPVSLTIYRRHEGETDYVVYWKGRVAQVNWDNDQAQITCEPTLARMKRVGLQRLHSPSCQHPLYGPRCAVTRANWTHTCTIDAISSDGLTLTSSDFSALAALHSDYLAYGGIQLADGNPRFIMSQDDDEIVLLQQYGSALVVGQTVSVSAGCKGRFVEDCMGKFADDGGDRPNGETGKYHGGYPHMPEENIFNEGFE